MADAGAGDDRAVGGDPLVGSELLLQLPDREGQGEPGVGLGFHAGLFPGTGAQRNRGEAEQSECDNRQQDHQRDGDHQRKAIGLCMMAHRIVFRSHDSLGIQCHWEQDSLNRLSATCPKKNFLPTVFQKITVKSMKPFSPLSAVDQLVVHLRDAITRGELGGAMPGIRRLASTLGVSSKTVTAALERLAREGFLDPQGHGRRTRIALPEGIARPAFRVTLLLYERADVQVDYVVEIQRRLKEEGHDVNVADKSLMDLGMKVSRIARMVEQTETDAWVVFSAPQEVLEWFVNHSLPAFALFGRFRNLPLAATGLNKVPAFRAAIRRLAELGHRRIVLLQPKHNREPTPALLVRESLEEMETNGIKPGSYNIPDWEQSPSGLRNCLDSLFALTAPTAIIFDRPNELIGAQIHLAQKGIFAPRDISLICDDDPAFEWCKPSISCIRWQSRRWVSRIINWVDNVANGKNDLRQSFTKAKFIERGSIGPVSSI